MEKQIKSEYDCKKLKEAIKQKGIAQKEFANMVGVTDSTLSHVLTGIRNPSVTLNKMMCVVLGVPEDEFIIKPEPPTEPVQDNAVTAVHESTDKLLVQLDRMERKLDRLEMLVRSVQNENLALRQELLKRK